MCDFHWSDLIWRECVKSLQRPNPGLSKKEVGIAYQDIHEILGDYEYLDNEHHLNQIERMRENIPPKAMRDPKDVHVKYLADWSGSDYLVTTNLKDFTGEVTENFRFKVVSLDDFLCELIDASPKYFMIALTRTIAPMTKQGDTVQDIIERLGDTEKEKGYDCPNISRRLLADISDIEKAVEIERRESAG